MNKTLKILFYLLLACVGIVAISAAYIQIKGIPNYPYAPGAEIEQLKVPADSLMIERGAKIAALLCNECHMGSDGKLSGKIMTDAPKEFGKIATLNITHDTVHGIGNWTDGEIYYFLRTGIRKDGSWSPPFMPKFPLMADEEVKSVIAWLRSNDPKLEASDKEYPPNQPNFLMKFLNIVAFFPPPLPKQAIAMPDSNNLVAFGKYVANDRCACYACHSADFKTLDILVPERSKGFYGGGNPMLNYEGDVIPSSNITMDPATGIGNWTEAQFVETVKYGKKPDGSMVRYPMFPHTTLTDKELKGVFAYLKTIPPIQNRVKRSSF